MKGLFMASQNVRALLAAAALAVGVSACGGGGSGPPPACDVQKILFTTYGCAIPACHNATAPAAAFDMGTPGWEMAMLDRVAPGGGPMATASMCGSMNHVYLVKGSVPAKGLFIDKLNLLTPPCGKRMPNIGGPLTAAELACVQTWADALTAPK